MLSHFIIIVSCAVAVSAWMPQSRNMTARDGNDLFESKDIPSSNDKRSGNATEDWLPGKLPIRGVNLGSMFVVEPWMASTEWSNVLECGSTQSEWDCVTMLGQSQANANWANHWSSWITESDIETMSSYSLNTIRIPVGYWIWEDLKYSK